MCAAVYYSRAPPPSFGGAPSGFGAPPTFGTSAASFAAAHGGRGFGFAGNAAAPTMMAGRTPLPGPSFQSPLPLATNVGMQGPRHGAAGGLGSAIMPAGIGCMGSAAVPGGAPSHPAPLTPRRHPAGLQVRGPADVLSQTGRNVPDMLSQTGRNVPDMLSQTGRNVPDMLSQTGRARPTSGYPPSACFGGGSTTPQRPVTPLPQRSPPQQASNGQQLSATQPGRARALTPSAPRQLGGNAALKPFSGLRPPATTTTSENAPPAQDRGKVKAEPKHSPGVAGSPCPWREALREFNALQPDARAEIARGSPMPTKRLEVPAKKRSPVSKPHQPDFRNLESRTPEAAAPVGRCGGQVMELPLSEARSLLGAAIAGGRSGGLAGAVAAEEAPMLPRELAAEALDYPPSLLVSLANAHPMVTPEEKECVLGLMQAFSETVESEGGFLQYAIREDCQSREELIGKLEEGQPPLTPEELLRRSSEAMMRQVVRNGADSITVQLGGICSMGMKKVVKLEVKCEDFQMQQQLSICWDWDVKLERRSLHAED